MAYTTIDDPEAYFQTVLYTGNGGTQSITLGGTTDMQPDLVWIKERDATDFHVVGDAVRGTSKQLYFNDVQVENTNTSSVTAFNSDGFSLGDRGDVNQSSSSYVAWCFKESATSGFDIVTYTGNGTDDTDISHNLSAVPKMIIVKNRDAADAWQVYHGANTSAPETDYLVLNDTAVTADAADRWSDEAPTSSVFTLGDGDEVNTNTENYIAYCFAEKQGFSKFGSYTGNGVSSGGAQSGGPFINLGFRPAFLMIKEASGTAGQGWMIFDNTRSTFNRVDHELQANSNAVETTGSHWVDFYSNGFNTRTNGAAINRSGSTHIYMAFAEAPFVNSNGVPATAR